LFLAISKASLDCSPGLEEASNAARRVQTIADLTPNPAVGQGQGSFRLFLGVRTFRSIAFMTQMLQTFELQGTAEMSPAPWPTAGSV